MNTRWTRFLRGWFAAAFATFVAAFSHTLAGGPLPSVLAIGASLLLSAALCIPLAGKTVSLIRLSIAMGISQALFHTVFAGSESTAVVIGGSHHATIVMQDAAAHHAGSMWLAHAIAGAITVLAFRYGEAAYWGILDSARLLLQSLVRSFDPPTALWVTPAPPLAAEPARLLPSLVSLSPMRHRGPPAAIGFS